MYFHDWISPSALLTESLDSSQVMGIHLPVLWAKVHLHDHTTTQARCFNQGSLWVNWSDWSVLRWLAKKYDQVVLPCWMPRTLRFSTSSLEFENHVYRPNNANWWGICMHFTETYYLSYLLSVSCPPCDLCARVARGLFWCYGRCPPWLWLFPIASKAAQQRRQVSTRKNNNCLWVYEFSLFTFVINTTTLLFTQVINKLFNTLVLRWDA